jgi:ribosomal protein L7/L12
MEAEYLRSAVSVGSQSHQDEVTKVTRLLKLAQELPKDWREAAGSRFAVVLSSYGRPERRIPTIKRIREAIGVGLQQAVNLAHYVPSQLVANATFERAAEVWMEVVQEPSAVLRVHPGDIDLSDVPFGHQYRVIVGYSERNGVDPPPHTDPTGPQAFREFVQSELQLSVEDARERCRSELVVIAENLFTADADRLLENLWRRIHDGGLQHGPSWFIYARRVSMGLFPTDE